MTPPAYRDITVHKLHRWMTREPDSVFILDVREPFEFDIAAIDGAALIPLRQVAARANEIPTDRRVVVVCHHGVRSAAACQMLSAIPALRLYNLQGGIDQWSLQIDPEVDRY